MRVSPGVTCLLNDIDAKGSDEADSGTRHLKVKTQNVSWACIDHDYRQNNGMVSYQLSPCPQGLNEGSSSKGAICQILNAVCPLQQVLETLYCT